MTSTDLKKPSMMLRNSVIPCSRNRSIVNLTSSAVIGVPSAKVTSSRSVTIT